jgi:hypothetical protein
MWLVDQGSSVVQSAKPAPVKHGLETALVAELGPSPGIACVLTSFRNWVAARAFAKLPLFFALPFALTSDPSRLPPCQQAQPARPDHIPLLSQGLLNAGNQASVYCHSLRTHLLPCATLLPPTCHRRRFCLGLPRCISFHGAWHSPIRLVYLPFANPKRPPDLCEYRRSDTATTTQAGHEVTEYFDTYKQHSTTDLARL